MNDSKPCSKCGVKFPLTAEFWHRHKKTRDGFAERCKPCRIEDNAQYRNQNRDKVNQSNRDYHARNRKSRNAGRSARYWKNPEESRAKNRARYPETAEQQKAASKTWRQANPEKRRLQERKRRARLAGVYSEPYTEQEILDIWGTDCHLCGKPIDLEAPRSNHVPGWELGLHLDHVIPIYMQGEDTAKNVKPAHGICNLKRSRPLQS